MWDFNVEDQAKEFKGGFNLIPEGWHKMVILTGEVQETKNGGKMLCLVIKCAEGEFTDRLNVVNASEIAQSIGLSQLAKICQCVGILGRFTPDRIPELFGRGLDVEVVIEEFKSNTTGKTLQSNKAKNYAPAGEHTSVTPTSKTREKSYDW